MNALDFMEGEDAATAPMDTRRSYAAGARGGLTRAHRQRSTLGPRLDRARGPRAPPADGLGGVPEAVERAKAGGRFEAESVLVRALRSRRRPAPYEAEGGKSSVIGQASLHGLEEALAGPRPGLIAELLAAHPSGPLMGELVTLALTHRSASRAVAWHPIAV